MKARIPLNQIHLVSDAKIFLDANIWLYLFCPLGDYSAKTVSNYSSAYKEILKSKNKIYTDLMIVSEVINRWLRFGHNQSKDGKKYKDYRKSSAGVTLAKDIWSVLEKKVLFSCAISNYSYSPETLRDLLNPDTQTDFNDRHILNLCRSNDHYLLTNDTDFVDADVPIISAHPAFYKSA